MPEPGDGQTAMETSMMTASNETNAVVLPHQQHQATAQHMATVIGNVPPTVMTLDDGVIDIKVLGRGTFSTVYLVDTQHAQRFVVKRVMRISSGSDPHNRAVHEINGMPTEAVALASLPAHPGVSRYLSASTTAKSHHLYFEYLPASCTLQQLMQGTAPWCKELRGYVWSKHKVPRVGGLEEDSARRLAAQLLDTLEHCHRHGIAHRDVKCDNIMMQWVPATADEGDEPRTIGECFRVVLIDFGFATWCGDGAAPCRTFPGSAPYAAPEIHQGVPYDPRQTDTWAAGVVLYVMLMGRLPFTGATSAEVRQAICETTLSYDRAVRMPSFHARQLLLGMMRRPAHRRTNIAGALAYHWFRL